MSRSEPHPQASAEGLRRYTPNPQDLPPRVVSRTVALVGALVWAVICFAVASGLLDHRPSAGSSGPYENLHPVGHSTDLRPVSGRLTLAGVGGVGVRAVGVRAVGVRAADVRPGVAETGSDLASFALSGSAYPPRKSTPQSPSVESSQIPRTLLRMGLIVGGAALLLVLAGGAATRLLALPTYRALRESERRYFDLFEQAPDLLLSVDPDSEQIRECNTAVVETLGLPREQIVGGGAFDLFDPKSLPPARDAWARILASGGVRNVFLDLRRGDGCVLPVNLNGAAVRGDDGEVAAVRLSMRDRTEVQEEHDRAQLLLATAEVILVALDLHGRVEMINRKGCEVLGRTEDELLGKDWFDVALPSRLSSEVRAVFLKTIQGDIEVPVHFENPVLTADGEERLVEWYNSFIRAEDGRFTGVLSSGQDVTDLRAAESARAESEARLRSLYEAVQAGVILQAASGEILHANEAAAEIFRMTPEEIYGKTSMDPAWRMIDESGKPVPGEDHPSMVTFRTGRPVRGAVRGLFHGDPERARWLIINTEPLVSAATGDVEEVVITFQDISGLKEAEALLRDSRTQAQRYLDVAEVMLVALDTQGRIEMINRKGRELLGHSEAELLGKDWFEVALPPENAAEVREVFQGLTAGDLASFEQVENAVVDARGETRIVSWRNAVIRGKDGQIKGTISSGIDVTAQRRSEAALRESEARFRALFMGAPLAYQSLDPDGRFLDVNEAFSSQFGYGRDELVGSSFAKVLDKRSQILFQERFPVFKRVGQTTNVEFTLIARDGSSRMVSIDGRVHRASDGTMERTHCILTDITEKRKAEEKLTRSREMLRALSARLTLIREEERALIARDLHDQVGQTLTGLRMDLVMERSNLSDDAVEMRERFNQLIETIDQNIDFIRQLSSWLRPPILDVLGLGPALEWHVEEHRERSSALLHVEVPEDGPELSKEVEVSLFRIAQEALTNVFRHAGAENVWISLRSGEDGVTLQVADDGRGISPGAVSEASSLGLLGMHERALGIGGELAISQRGAGGTVVKVTVPRGHSENT